MSAVIIEADRRLALELTPDIGNPMCDHVAACQRVAAQIAEFRERECAKAIARQIQPGVN